MKYLLMSIAVIMIFAAPVLADQGNLSQQQLAKMGLSGMTVMSDMQGTSVRGMGTVFVSGRSVAILLGSSGASGFSATGGQLAAGSSASAVVLISGGCLVAVTSASGRAIAVIR
jgi:hypothetical protein